MESLVAEVERKVSGTNVFKNGLLTTEQFSERIAHARKLLKRLRIGNKNFYYNPETDLTSFVEKPGFKEANWILCLAEDLFGDKGKKETGFLLLERIAHPLELLEKNNAL